MSSCVQALPACRTAGGPLDEIQVNFDPGLVAMLRETRYFRLVAAELPGGLPDLATKVGMAQQCTCIQNATDVV